MTGPLLDDRTGRVIGVTARRGGAAAEGAGRGAVPADQAERSFRGRVVIAADGNSSRLSVSMGLQRRDDRPLGVAVRTYYSSPRHDDDYLEAWLDLWDGDTLLPGYGWIFGMGDGTSNVGLGLLNTSSAFQHIDYRVLLRRWLAAMPAEWGFSEENRTQPIRGAALPMGFNRTPHYANGLLLAGDAGGMVNPFNGEGIGYALESGEIAARVITQALSRPTAASAELALRGYPAALNDAYGGYYTLARTFVRLIGRPGFMQFATRHGVKRPAVMRLTMKLLGNLTETRGGDAVDRLVNALSKMTPRGLAAPMTTCRSAMAREPEEEVTAVLSLYVPILVLAALAAVFALFSLVMGSLAGPKRWNRAKLEAYECGIEPTRQPSGIRFPVKYYLTAMLFIVFDIEIIFLYPWAVAFDRLGVFGLVEMVTFIGTVLVAYAYVWRRGGLEWD